MMNKVRSMNRFLNSFSGGFLSGFLRQLTMLFLFAFFTNASVYAANAYGEKPTDRVDEVDVRSVKVTGDRTGIVKDVYCFGCDFNIVNITKNTKATRGGVPVDILEIREAVNVVVGVAFDPKTREVLRIDW